MSDTIYTVVEVAEMFHIGESTLYEYIQKGIPITCHDLAVWPIMLNGKPRYGRAAIDSLLSHVVEVAS